jgi:hypothetical protein
MYVEGTQSRISKTTFFAGIVNCLLFCYLQSYFRSWLTNTANFTEFEVNFFIIFCN